MMQDNPRQEKKLSIILPPASSLFDLEKAEEAAWTELETSRVMQCISNIEELSPIYDKYQNSGAYGISVAEFQLPYSLSGVKSGDACDFVSSHLIPSKEALKTTFDQSSIADAESLLSDKFDALFAAIDSLHELKPKLESAIDAMGALYPVTPSKKVPLEDLLELSVKVDNTLKKYDSAILPTTDAVEAAVDSRNFTDREDTGKSFEASRMDVFNIIYGLRHFKRNIVIDSVSRLLKYVTGDNDNLADDSPVSAASIDAMIKARALQMLLAAKNRFGNSPEAVLQISKLITILAAHEQNVKAISKNLHEILNSLSILSVSCSVDLKRTCSSCMKYEELSAMQNKPSSGVGRSIESSYACVYCSDNKKMRTRIATAAEHISLVLSNECDESKTSVTVLSDSVGMAPRRRKITNILDGDSQRILTAILGIIRTISPMSASNRDASASAQSANLPYSTLRNASGGMSPCISHMQVELSSVQCAAAIANFSCLTQCREPLIAAGAFRLLVSWLEQCVQIVQHPDDIFCSSHPSFELCRHVCLSLAHLTGAVSGKGPEICPQKPASSGSSNSHTIRQNEVLRSSVSASSDTAAHYPGMSEGVPECLVQLIEVCIGKNASNGFKYFDLSKKAEFFMKTLSEMSSETDDADTEQTEITQSYTDEFDASFVPVLLAAKYSDLRFQPGVDMIDHNVFSTQLSIYSIIPPNCLPSGSMELIAKIFSHLASRVTNRGHLMQANVPRALCAILINAVSWRDCMVDTFMTGAGVIFTANGTSVHLEELLHEEEEDSSYLSKVVDSSLQALLFFLSDSILHISTPARGTVKVSPNGTPNLNMSSAEESKTNTSLRRLCRLHQLQLRVITHNAVFEALKSVISLPRGIAKLAALRLLCAISEKKDIRDNLAVSMVAMTEALLHTASESADVLERDHAYPGLGGLGGGGPSMIEGGVGAGYPRPLWAMKPNPPVRETSQGSVSSSRSVDESELKEETMLVCAILANICQDNQENCELFFEKNIAKIALKLIHNSDPQSVISYQALRCLSSVCAVVTRLPREELKAQFITDIAADETALPRRMHESTFNVFCKALIVFDQSLDPNLLFNSPKEALRGLARLANDDQLSVGIVIMGTLQKVVGRIVDPESDLEIRDLGENVIRKLGFQKGLEDLQLVGFDCGSLAEWFYMKRSLKVQDAAQIMISDILKEYVEGSLSADRTMHEAVFVQLLDLWIALGQSKVISPAQQRQNPFSNDAFYNYITSCYGQTAEQRLLLEKQADLQGILSLGESSPSLRNSSLSTSSVITKCSNSSTHSASERSREVSDIIIPPKVQEFMDIFYPSKLHQQCIIDTIDLGLGVFGLQPALPTTSPSHSGISTDFAFGWPREKRVILLPSRFYVTFQRIGKIVERILDEANRPALIAPKTLGRAFPGHHGVDAKAEFEPVSTNHTEPDAQTNCTTSYNTWSLCMRNSSFDSRYFINESVGAKY